MAEFLDSLGEKKRRTKEEEDLLFLGFGVHDQFYGLGIFAVKEILKIPEIFPVPKAPDFIKGIMDLRGEIIPILDFRERLGFGPVDLAKGRVVVAVLNGKLLGLLVDSAEEVFHARVSEIKAAPEIFSKNQNGFIEGMVHLKGKMYLVLSPGRLLTSREKSTLENSTWTKDA